jgi:acetyl-CoA carboxylase biotin carboxyl carrier protein
MMHLARAEIVSNVWKIEVADGDRVVPGDVLAVLESMKMEIPLVASVHGHVSRVLASLGQIVQEGDPVVEIEESATA